MRAMLATAVLGLAALSPIHAAAEDYTQGKALFDEHCGICHAAGGTGTFMLGRRLGESNALLAQRRNLPPAMVEVVVRHGIGSMPWFTRTELPDADLALLAAYLSRTESVHTERAP